MAKEEKPEEVEDVVEEVEEEVEDAADDDESNWDRMKKLVSDTIDERLEAWQAKQPKKMTSSSSPRKAAAPKRKQGFLTTGFFSGLTDDK